MSNSDGEPTSTSYSERNCTLVAASALLAIYLILPEFVIFVPVTYASSRGWCTMEVYQVLHTPINFVAGVCPPYRRFILAQAYFVYSLY